MAERIDVECVLLARQGSKEAFGRLIEDCQPMMMRIALRMVNTQDAAQDVVQEAMLQAYLSLKELRSPESFRSWVYGIVLNVAKSYLREVKRKYPLDAWLNDEEAAQPVGGGGAGQDPQNLADERELHFVVLRAISQLPAAHREATRLFYYESLTLHEIAAMTGVTPGAVKVRLHRARNHLRDRLQNTYGEINPGRMSHNRRKKMIKTSVADIVKQDGHYIVILQENGGDKILPIWVGPHEATAIAIGLRAFPMRRPQTFDFMAHLLAALGAQLVEARVEVLKGEVFFGIAKIKNGGVDQEVDARPSDVIALAVRTGSPIFVSEDVMRQASKDIPTYMEQIGPFEPGEGVAAILKEVEEQLKQVPLPPPEEEGDQPQPHA